MVPVMPANMKRAGLPGVTSNPPPGLKTCPVGTGADGGIDTTRAVILPTPSYSVPFAVPASDTQNGEVAENDTPQGFFRLGSVTRASPGISDTRLTWL